MKKLLKVVGICLAIFVVGFIAFGIWAVHAVNNHKAQQEANDKWVVDAGQRYYDAQKKYYDKLAKTMKVTPEQLNINTDVATATKHMQTCIWDLDQEHCEFVIAGTLWMGEPKLWVEASIGPYTSSKNTTTVNGLVHEQWVYGNPLTGAMYVYFDNDKLSSWQTSE